MKNISTNSGSNKIKDNSNNNKQIPKKKHESNNLYRSKETKNKHIETFIDTIEKQLFEKNIKRIPINVAYKERKALAELKSMGNAIIRIQNKGSRFDLIRNQYYEKKVEHQIARSSFKELP